jgi:hypothetical protein
MDVVVTISMNLVESLVNQQAQLCSVLLIELKHSMEIFIQNGLIRGCPVTLEGAFDCAWRDLVLEEPQSMSISDDETTRGDYTVLPGGLALSQATQSQMRD